MVVLVRSYCVSYWLVLLLLLIVFGFPLFFVLLLLLFYCIHACCARYVLFSYCCVLLLCLIVVLIGVGRIVFDVLSWFVLPCFIIDVLLLRVYHDLLLSCRKLINHISCLNNLNESKSNKMLSWCVSYCLLLLVFSDCVGLIVVS